MVKIYVYFNCAFLVLVFIRARLLLSISVYAVGLFEAPWPEDKKIEATRQRRIHDFSKETKDEKPRSRKP